MGRNLAEWLSFQQSTHAHSIDLELSRVAAVARRLGIDRPRCPVITVGGTNGKGSVVAHLEAFLRAAGLAAGVFTSPHLVRYNERVRVGGVEAADAELVAAFERIEAARGGITLTYFEYGTLAALLVFAQRAIDIAILEVGLGGRLDASNLIDASVAVVVSIGFDHRDWLGETLEEIGREKAGIFRAGRPAVLGSPDMPASVFAAIEAVGARPIVAERDFTWSVGKDTWSYRGRELTLDDLPPSALPGAIQYRNAATAIAALEALFEEAPAPTLPRKRGRGQERRFPLPRSTGEGREGAIASGLRSVELPGRFQIIPGSVEWILDVAHNEPAARVLAMHLRERPLAARTFAVASILADKDIAAIGRALAPAIDHWIVCPLNEPRGLPAPQLAARLELPDEAITLAESVAAGCELARCLARPGDRVIVCGSFLTVGAALQWL